MEITGHPRLEARRDVCAGKPTIKKTRMRVTDIVGALAAGGTIEDLLVDFPHLSIEDLRACLAYAAEVSNRPLAKAAA